MTRFEMDLRGMFGDYWQKDANKRLDQIEAELESGKITIDANGVAYNCIGRVVSEEIAIMLHYVTTRINLDATATARDVEVEKSAREYRERMKNHVYSAEELSEMRNAFGAGTTVVDVITGKRITL